MTLRFEQILTEGIAQLSYLVGDDAAGTAAVIDPRPDVGIYLELARRHGLSITHVLETHIHADFMSGARQLVERLGGSAELCVSAEGGARYGFEHRPLRDGEVIELGSVVLTARFTPGHTPEHLSYLLAEKGRRDHPWGVLSGDSLFVASAGRPDLLGEEQTEALTGQLLDTLRGFYLSLPDDVILYPGHGAGSPCGPGIGDRTVSTIGYERRYNRFLRIEDRDAFRRAMHDGAPPVPTHYPRMKKINAEGPVVLPGGPAVPALTPRAFANAVNRGQAQLVDTRDMQAFGGGHIEGALNIGARPELSVWGGWLLDPERPIFLVLERDSDLERVTALLWRIGLVRFAGYLAGGMTAWRNAGLPMRKLAQTTVQELREAGDRVQNLDVRAPGEWRAGHVPGARHRFVPELARNLEGLDRSRPLVTYCASGYRASIAASLLQAQGFTDVRAVPGSWQAWRSAGFPVEKPGA